MDLKAICLFHLTKIALLVALVVGFCTSACAASLVDLVPKADAIVVAKAFDRTDSGRSVRFRLLVERSLKGILKPDTELTLEWPSQWPNDQNFGATTWRGIWFLAGAGKAYHVLPVRMGAKAFFGELFYPVSSVALPVELAVDTQSSVTDMIAVELANAALRDGSADILEATASLESTRINAVFQLLSATGGARQRAIGLAGLIARNDTAALVQFEATVAAMGAADLALPAAAIRVWFRTPDEVAIAALARLAGSGPEVLRDAAVEALSDLHTQSAVPALAALLDDSNPDHQRRAIRGLAAFANGAGIHVPSDAARSTFSQTTTATPYRTADTERHWGGEGRADSKQAALAELQNDVTFWKKWWAQHQTDAGFPRK